MELWEKILLGVLALLLILWFRPGLKASLEQSRRAEHKDWRGVLIPIGIVVLFVLLLISMT
jgi:hypothetical protein